MAPLKLHHLRPAPGAKTAKTRVGRGEGSKGKTAGRGTKGTKARNTVSMGFEGGQVPLHMRLPKLKGFKNPFREEYQPVNVSRLGELFPDGGTVDVEALVAKGVEEAKKSFFRVPRIGGTIPHPVQGEKAAGVVFLRPASPGTGVIAGGPVRAVLEAAGVHDVLSKSLGSSNAINIVHATVEALRSLESPEMVAKRRGLPVEDVAPAALLKAQAAFADEAKAKSGEAPDVVEVPA